VETPVGKPPGKTQWKTPWDNLSGNPRRKTPPKIPFHTHTIIKPKKTIKNTFYIARL